MFINGRSDIIKSEKIPLSNVDGWLAQKVDDYERRRPPLAGKFVCLKAICK